MNLEQTLNEITGKLYGKNIGACTDAQLYTGVLQLTKEKMAESSAGYGRIILRSDNVEPI